METFGQRLKEVRIKKGLTQSQLAEGICTPLMLSQVEGDQARPSSHILSKFAEKLELPVDALNGSWEQEMALVREYRLAKRMLSVGDFTTALSRLKNIMERNEGKLDAFMLRYEYGECLLHLHQWKEAEVWFQQLLDDAKVGSPVLVVRVLHMLGQMEMKRKRYPMAEQHVTRGLSHMEVHEVRDVHLHASLLVTLGDVQQEAGDWQGAIDTLQRAVPLFQQREDLRGLEELYWRLAKVAKEAGEEKQEERFAQRATWVRYVRHDQGESGSLDARVEVGERGQLVATLIQSADELREIKREEGVEAAFSLR